MSTDLRITVAEYDRMIKRGDFNPQEEHHVELIRGEIREMSPIHPPHEDALDRILEWSFENASRKAVRVRCQLSLGLPQLESVPQPDLACVRQGAYHKRRPTAADVLLVVEIADTTLRYDRGEKADLYAEAGIADYWVVAVNRRTVEVCRKPAGGEFQQRTIVPLTGSVAPLAFPKLKLPVADLFPSVDDD